MQRILLSTLLLTLGNSALACTCIPQSIESKIEAAAHVFRARVISFERTILTLPGTELTTDLLFEPRYEVMDVLKGNPAQLDHIYALPACGPFLESGHDYVFIVFVDPRFDLATTGNCGSTIDLGDSPRSMSAWTEFLAKLALEQDD